MLLSKVLILAMAVLAVIAGLDRCFGYRLGFGHAFEDGFAAMGQLAMIMIGVACLSPYLSKLISAVFAPLFTKIGADPSVACAIFAATDSGCYPMAKAVAGDAVSAEFSTFYLAATLAPAWQYILPLGLLHVTKEQTDALSLGAIAGLLAIPAGAFPAGILLRMPVMTIARDILPVCIFDLAAVTALFKAPQKTIAVFAGCARLFSTIFAFGLCMAIFQELTGIILLKDLSTSTETVVIIGQIAFLLAGAYPMIVLLRKVFHKKISATAVRFGVDETSIVGMIGTLANFFAALPLLSKMSRKGVALNIAFAVGAGWVFGDHLAFAAAQSPSSILPMIAGKLTAGVVGAGIAGIFAGKFLAE